MYCPDIESLSDFYKTPLGEVACRVVRERICEAWPDVGSGARLAKPEHIAAIGYAAPYLEPLMADQDDKSGKNKSSYRFCSVMLPAHSSARSSEGNQETVLMINEKDLPFEDEAVDRVMLIHSLEFSSNASHFMREIWRVLNPGGKLLIVVPNRTGLWSRSDRTPFGHGRPYSLDQIKKLLTDSMFMLKTSEVLLYTPPTKISLLLRASNMIERIGSTFLSPIGGILLAGAEKQLYSVTAETITEKSGKLATAADL